MYQSQPIWKESANSMLKREINIIVSSKVYLDIKYIHTTQLWWKLNWKHLGPYDFSGIVLPGTYTPDVPSMVTVYLGRFVSILDSVMYDALLWYYIPLPPAMEVNGVEVYQVESIEDIQIYS